MKTTIQNNEVNQRLSIFLEKIIDADDLAKYLRQFLHEAIRLSLIADEQDFRKDRILQGHYFITQLCEILEPHLENKEYINNYLEMH